MLRLVKLVVFSLTAGICLANGISAATECGEILSGGFDTYGEIDYKYNSTYENDERCVWIIRIPEATQIQFTLHTTNNVDYDLDDGLCITTFARTKGIVSAKVEQYILRLDEIQTFTMYGNVAVVTFFSDSLDTYEGFRLEYIGMGQSTSQNTSAASQDFVSNMTMDKPSLELFYPAEGFYANQELSTFVISYPDFRYQLGAILTVKLNVDLAGQCDFSDVIITYRFSPTLGWTLFDNMCTGESISKHRDIVLLVFKSDDQNVSTGMRITALVQPEMYR